MHIKRLDHVGIVVSDLEAAVRMYEQVLGLPVTQRTERPGVVRIAFFTLPGGVRLELLEKTPGTQPAAQASRPGIHHFALEVEDVDTELTTLVHREVPLWDPVSKPGLTCKKYAYIAPEATGGTPVELLERRVES